MSSTLKIFRDFLVFPESLRKLRKIFEFNVFRNIYKSVYIRIIMAKILKEMANADIKKNFEILKGKLKKDTQSLMDDVRKELHSKI